MANDELQPRALDDAPRDVWLLASALLGEPAPDTTSPHICGIEIDAVTTHGETVTIRYWQRDCPGCWDAGWRPKRWAESVAQAAEAALVRQQMEAQIEETGGEIEPAVPEHTPQDDKG